MSESGKCFSRNWRPSARLTEALLLVFVVAFADLFAGGRLVLRVPAAAQTHPPLAVAASTQRVWRQTQRV